MIEQKLTPKERQMLEEQGRHPLVIDVLESTMNRHNLTSELILDMTNSGWLAYEIICFCDHCVEVNIPIDSAWRLHQRLVKDKHPLFVTT